MSRYSVSLVVGIALVVGVVVATQWPREEPAPIPPPDIVIPATASAPVPAAGAPPVEPAASTTSVAPAPVAATAAETPPRALHPLETQLRESRDLLAFAQGLLPRAREGDRDSQYFLYAAMDYCRDGYREYFDQGRERRSLDAALDGAANTRMRDEIARVHSRCRALMESDDDALGEPEQWLAQAARAGQPRAQIEQAARMARNSPNLPASQLDRSLADARRLARDSLATRDPAVIWKLGEITALRGESAADVDFAAYARAACDRGLDCGPGSAAAEDWCRVVPDCQPSESVADMILRSSPDPSRVAELARELNARIDAADWPALGLADPRP